MIESIIANAGIWVEIENTEVLAIFRQNSKSIDENGMLITVKRPRITFKLSDFPTVEEGQDVKINEIDFIIKQVEYDDAGAVTCHLFKKAVS